MRNLEQYGKQCIENLNAIGIYPNDISEFRINTRAKKRWGQACKKSGVYSININVLLLQDDCPERALLETLYHELLHCVDGCMNHGEKWQELAELVNDCYMVNITRASSDEEKLGVEYASEVREVKQQSLKIFAVQCVDCGNKCTRHGMRSPQWYAHPERYQCRKCGGKLKKVVDK